MLGFCTALSTAVRACPISRPALLFDRGTCFRKPLENTHLWARPTALTFGGRAQQPAAPCTRRTCHGPARSWMFLLHSAPRLLTRHVPVPQFAFLQLSRRGKATGGLGMALTNYLFLFRLTGFPSLRHTEECSCAAFRLGLDFSSSFSKQIMGKPPINYHHHHPGQ